MFMTYQLFFLNVRVCTIFIYLNIITLQIKILWSEQVNNLNQITVIFGIDM